MDPVTWVYHPAREYPLRLALAAVVISGVSVGLWRMEANIWLGVVAFLLLSRSVAPFLLPTRYTLTRREVIITRWGFQTRRRWEDLRRWQWVGNGVVLSPYLRPHWLESQRALFLWGGDEPTLRALLTEVIGPSEGIGGAV